MCRHQLAGRSLDRSDPRGARSRRRRSGSLALRFARSAVSVCSTRHVLRVLLTLLAGASPVAAQTDGERAWRAGYDAALVGRADAALTAYTEAIRLARQDRDPELASAARLGMAEVWDVWRRCRDSARIAYEDAVALAGEGDYAAADAYAIWLARQGNDADARRLHARAYLPIENEVPRSVTRESVSFLLTLAAIQVANQSRSGAMVSLTAARDIADRLAAGGEDANGSPTGVTAANYWALHDIAALQLDPASGPVRNVGAGRTLQQRVDDATPGVSDLGGLPRFAAARLADRVARTRRTCRTASCQLPPPPAVPRCR
jgi:hypothetical protein